MTDYYRHFAHPVLHLSPAAPTDLFTEMDQIADELRANPEHIEVDDQIAFQQLQKVRRPGITKAQWLDLFEVWRLRYMARQEARRTDVGKLWQERDGLIAERASLSADESIDARLCEVVRKLAAAIFA